MLQRIIATLQDNSSFPKTRRVLDAGCGSGLHGEALKNGGFGPITGVDVSQELLARGLARGCYSTVEEGDLNKALRWDANSFDFASSVGVLTYINAENKPNFLNELCRVVCPGGLVIYTCRTDMQEPWVNAADELVNDGKWSLVERSDQLPYLPNNPEYADRVLVVIYCYQVC